MKYIATHAARAGFVFSVAKECIALTLAIRGFAVQSANCYLLRTKSSKTFLSLLLPYGIAAVSIAIVMSIRMLLDPLLGDHLPFGPFVIAIVITSWLGGWKPSLVSLLLGLLAGAFFFMPPRWSFRVDQVAHQVSLVLYFFVGITTILLFESIRKARHRAEEALANVKILQGLLPICAWCKKIRDDQNYWRQVESYLAEHTGAQFTHSICPSCLERLRKTT
jgi:K+-sensing histidine kinase KdpD